MVSVGKYTIHGFYGYTGGLNERACSQGGGVVKHFLLKERSLK